MSAYVFHYINIMLGPWGGAQVVDCLSSNHEALNLNPRTSRKKGNIMLMFLAALIVSLR
jgi:hypothetical protein